MMKWQAVLFVLTGQLTATIAGPVPDPVADPAPTRAHDAVAQAETCTITGTGVNCRYHTNTGSEIKHVFNNGIAFFACNSPGECINGNCMWDWHPGYDCFVSAYYTGPNCNPDNLPNCGFS